MKKGLSGSAVNELDVSDYWEAQRKLALDLLARLKSIPCDKLYRENSHTIKSEGFDALMKKRTHIKHKFKRSDK